MPLKTLSNTESRTANCNLTEKIDLLICNFNVWYFLKKFREIGMLIQECFYSQFGFLQRALHNFLFHTDVHIIHNYVADLQIFKKRCRFMVFLFKIFKMRKNLEDNSQRSRSGVFKCPGQKNLNWRNNDLFTILV